MRWSPLFAALLVLAACQSSKPESEAGAAPSAEPTAKPRSLSVNMSEQKGVKRPPAALGSPGAADSTAGGGVLPGLPGATDGRELDAGAGFHDEARKGCSDEKCVGDNCTRLCADWTNKNPPKSADARNKAYFGCIGACLTEVDK